MAIWNRVNALIFGGAIGAASRTAIEPQIEPARQKAWSLNKNRVLGVGDLARLVAQGLTDKVSADEQAGRSGFDENRLAAMIQLELRAASVAQALELWRRDKITREQAARALSKAQIEEQYHEPILALKDDILDPGQLAAAIHRGLVPDPGILLGEQPSGPRNVESYPVYPIDALLEALGSGYDHDRLGVLVGLQGLPMGSHEAAQALFRGIITHGDYIAAFNESNSRNEWAEAVLEQSRQIPTARDFFENALRGYHSFAWALEQAKRHGMSDADATVIYQNQGRPMAIKQITQALSRGGVFHPEPGEIHDPYMASVVEGNVKPGYYDLALSLKYTLPSVFVMKSLTIAGTWTEAKAAKRLKDVGWIPEDADEAAAHWAASAAGSGASYVAKAQTHLWTTTHRSYIDGEADVTDVQRALSALGIDEASQEAIIGLWDHERELRRKQLTPAQIKKLYHDEQWSQAEAVARLESMGYSTDDAIRLLTE